MLFRQLLAAATIAAFYASLWAGGDEIRYFEKDGVTYRESRQVIHKRIPEVVYEQRDQTVYRDECVTEMKDTVRTCWVPVTEYQVREQLVGRWNPLVRPYFEYRSVPITRWEPRTEVVQVPTASRKLVPETRTTRTPVTSWRTVEEEVISRVAVGTSSSASTLASSPPASTPSILAGPLVPVEIPGSARRDEIGGLTRLDSDPPRQGAAAATRGSSDRFRR